VLTNSVLQVNNLLTPHKSSEASNVGPSTTCTINGDSQSSISAMNCTNTEWHLNFMIPQKSSFTNSVQEAIRTGVITSKARREIISVLRTYIVAHTVYPTSEQYNTVCRKLVSKFPNLMDTELGKSTIVSIKLVIT